MTKEWMTGRVAYVETSAPDNPVVKELFLPLFRSFSLLNISKEQGLSDYGVFLKSNLQQSDKPGDYVQYAEKDMIGDVSTRVHAKITIFSLANPYLALHPSQRLTVAKALLYQAVMFDKRMVPSVNGRIRSALSDDLDGLLSRWNDYDNGRIISILSRLK